MYNLNRMFAVTIKDDSKHARLYDLGAKACHTIGHLAGVGTGLYIVKLFFDRFSPGL